MPKWKNRIQVRQINDASALSPFPFLLPKSWKEIQASGKYKKLGLPIQFVPLPTYSPWLNPIEKLWRWLKKDVIHNHSFANNFKELKKQVDDFLQNLEQLATQTLSYVGLRKSDGIYAQQLKAAGAPLPNLSC